MVILKHLQVKSQTSSCLGQPPTRKKPSELSSVLRDTRFSEAPATGICSKDTYTHKHILM